MRVGIGLKTPHHEKNKDVAKHHKESWTWQSTVNIKKDMKFG